jgi:hypothetical protein
MVQNIYIYVYIYICLIVKTKSKGISKQLVVWNRQLNICECLILSAASCVLTFPTLWPWESKLISLVWAKCFAKRALIMVCTYTGESYYKFLKKSTELWGNMIKKRIQGYICHLKYDELFVLFPEKNILFIGRILLYEVNSLQHFFFLYFSNSVLSFSNPSLS